MMVFLIQIIKALGSVTIVQANSFYSGGSGRLGCNPQENNGKINWYQNLEPLNLTALSGVMSADKRDITFYNITSRLHKGVYSCENILNNGQVVYSKNMVTVHVIGRFLM